jgi:hypothetical protein
VLIKHGAARKGRHNFIRDWNFGTSGGVFRKCHSEGSVTMTGPSSSPAPCYSEFHHSPATACLVDRDTLDDGWVGVQLTRR